MSSVAKVGGPPEAGPQRGLDLGRKFRPGEAVIKALLLLAAVVSVVTTVGIVVALARPAIRFFREVPISEFLGSTDWSPNLAPQAFGVWPIVGGTLVTTFIGLLIAVPLGLGAAMYLSEYANAKTRRRLKPVLELLAGIPSVVYGFFALSFVTPTLLQGLLGINVQFTNALAAGLVLGVMIIPTIASLSEDSLSAVPQSLRQGSFAMAPTGCRQPCVSYSQRRSQVSPLRSCWVCPGLLARLLSLPSPPGANPTSASTCVRACRP